MVQLLKENYFSVKHFPEHTKYVPHLFSVIHLFAIIRHRNFFLTFLYVTVANRGIIGSGWSDPRDLESLHITSHCWQRTMIGHNHDHHYDGCDVCSDFYLARKLWYLSVFILVNSRTRWTCYFSLALDWSSVSASYQRVQQCILWLM